ncbi:U-box domain-containing protein 38-like [Juglans regia]|uniref:RING-type E3 ubiquitin transferase n=1 Tax=Juglans regia TaxID=51240 RepID=A0A2I4FIU7_JUGRE|nr:U-box domain-containing protein 38-like [Juglans regia]
MGGNGKHRWKISFHRTSTSTSSSSNSKMESKQPNKEFICPVSRSLMSDPVVVSSGQTFERVSVQVCRDLGYSPKLEDGSRPDFTTVISNLAIKSTILNWCESSGTDYPRAPAYRTVEQLVRSEMAADRYSGLKIRVSEQELLRGVADNPPVIFSHAATELGHRVNHFYSSSSEESVVIAGSPATPLPLTTRPSCYSSSSPSSEIVENETLTQTLNPQSLTPEEEQFLAKLKSTEVFEQEEAVISLRKLTRTREDLRVPLCTPRLLSAVRSLISSKYATVQTNAIALLLNLSLENRNKVQIVRSGFVPLLIEALMDGASESQEHAAGALFSLAIEDDNQMAIGVLGALAPLMHSLRSDSERTRNDSALALYHLTLIQSNRVKLVKLGSVPTLLAMTKDGNLASRVLLILCNLALCTEGKSVMLDANAVECLVGLLRKGEVDSEATRENCVAALWALSQGSMRFRGLAKDARAGEVLREIEERGSERAREKAKRILQMMRGREEEEEARAKHWEGVLDSGSGVSRNRYRVGSGRNVNGPSSTTF